MNLLPIFELNLVGAAEPNVPKRERVVLRPTEDVNLAEFGILVGLKNPAGDVIPLWDEFFWFGHTQVTPPSWIVLYTGHGEPTITTDENTGEVIHNFYWGRPKTVFALPQIVPVLFRIGGLVIGPLLHPPAPKLTPATILKPPAPKLGKILPRPPKKP